MSYDIHLSIDSGGPEPATVWGSWNYTSNCGAMWRRAGADLAEFEGKTAAECLPILVAAIRRMEDEPATYQAMNPPNGWGDYDSLLHALRQLADAFRAHPKATVEVHR
ncbi:hypothetical protein C1I95_31390 [Micromonospora craterilacus]|uniref:Uncharacterized protein n=1 Tax=Micromonospora craterilacus TaxID=1655439 RepID=A0A2W2DSS6_9ACTN|nr:hypothetical protein [Micromonospora craterilacus]PZG07179.1 hypothetical protein C1I95_31390 [Micromonospora craterilacus]